MKAFVVAILLIAAINLTTAAVISARGSLGVAAGVLVYAAVVVLLKKASTP